MNYNTVGDIDNPYNLSPERLAVVKKIAADDLGKSEAEKVAAVAAEAAAAGTTYRPEKKLFGLPKIVAISGISVIVVAIAATLFLVIKKWYK